ncbi:hypothetical protein K466DRAFT_485816 [Polyporus arcularius HHB13444]|uniref:Uncharacterized protein n=1 Tax=Polyporus arcularius HHB13444 TaxID=1314778 RepID=A0A5C3PUU1_9APHY|nr:hypothetical protein K466DRAFT_485816 [Polyporus arcularius HHB13444]
MSAPSTSSPAREKCRLAEVLQYKCTLEQEADGRPTVRCLPVPRIFRICPNRPAVEMTRFIDVDLETGAVRDIPSESSSVLPKGKPWRDVLKYEDVDVYEH